MLLQANEWVEMDQFQETYYDSAFGKKDRAPIFDALS
jgi:hypothetical protein